MNESGPVIRPKKTSEMSFDFSDIQSVAPNAWRVTRDGKYWLLKTARDGESASLELLRREYEISRDLQHPFIASTFMFLEDSPVGPAILMEYVEGCSLRDFIDIDPPKSTLRKIFSQILSAVEYLHNKGLLHNDIKPENIIVTAIGQDIKVIDFGYAENDSDYLNKRLGGTVGATAPEVFSGMDGIPSTASSDIYALGGLLRLLFPGRYSRIVKKCRRRDPSGRYSDVASLRKAIAESDRLPSIIIAIMVLVCFTALAATPGFVREQKDRRKEEVTQARIRQIQDDLRVLYQEALDSISNPSIIQTADQACLVIDNYTKRVAAYRNSIPEHELLFVYDTIRYPLRASLTSAALELPWE